MARKAAFARRAEEWIVSIQRTVAPQTLRSYRSELRVLSRDIARLGLEPDIRHWTEREALTIRDDLVARYKSKTVAKKIAVLNRLLQANDIHVIAKARQAGRYKLPTPIRGHVRWTTGEDRARLLAAAEEPLRTMLYLAFFMGVRRAGIVYLRMSDLSESELRVLGKGRRDYPMPILDPVRDQLMAYIQRERPKVLAKARDMGYVGPEPDLVFIRWTGTLNGYYPDWFTRAARNLGKRVGVAFSPHDARRVFATEAYEAEHDLIAVRDLLGHQSVRATEAYVQASDRRMRRVLARMYAATGPEEGVASNGL